jgi:ABC-type spermidine/putrescine transport system permease subunit I
MPGTPRRRTSLTALLPTAGLLPLVLWQIVFFVVPVALIVGVSFWRTKNYRLIPDFTFDNYAAIFARPAIWRALLLSVETAAFVTIACAVLAYPVAYFIAKKAGRWRGLLLVAVIAPFWVSIGDGPAPHIVPHSRPAWGPPLRRFRRAGGAAGDDRRRRHRPREP